MRFPRPNPVPVSSRYRYSKRRYRMLFGLLDGFCGPLWRLARRAAAARPWPEPRSILVVQLDHIGDAVLTTPMLRALRQRFPAAAIDVLASPWNREIFHGNPHLRYVHVAERNWQARSRAELSCLPAVWRLGRSMRRFRYDLGIDPRGDFLAALTLWHAGIPRRLGWGCGGGEFLLTDVAAWQPLRHEIESRFALVLPLGVDLPRAEPELYPSWDDHYAVRESLASLPEPHTPLAVVHIGAGTAAKRWPMEHWAKLVERLLSESAGSVILVGDLSDQERAHQLARGDQRLADWTGRLTLMQLAALVHEADLFVGVDSGPAHVAAAMGTPSVVLFSGTNRAECWRPVGHRVEILQSPTPCSPCHLKRCPVAGHLCMTGIQPSAVLDAVRRVLPTADFCLSRHSRYCDATASDAA